MFCMPLCLPAIPFCCDRRIEVGAMIAKEVRVEEPGGRNDHRPDISHGFLRVSVYP